MRSGMNRAGWYEVKMAAYLLRPGDRFWLTPQYLATVKHRRTIGEKPNRVTYVHLRTKRRVAFDPEHRVTIRIPKSKPVRLVEIQDVTISRGDCIGGIWHTLAGDRPLHCLRCDRPVVDNYNEDKDEIDAAVEALHWRGDPLEDVDYDPDSEYFDSGRTLPQKPDGMGRRKP